MGDSPSPEDQKVVKPEKSEEEMDQLLSESSSDSVDQDSENTEDSSTSGKSESEASTFDVVKDALKAEDKEDDETEGSSEKDKSEEGKEKSKDDSKPKEDESDEPTEAELASWKPKTRKRFEQLQVRLRDANQRAERAEVDAGQFRQFEEFLTSSNLSRNEANTLFDIGALMKSDPNKALQMITPYYNQLLEVTGNVLSPDLQQQVDQGYITEEHAYALSREKATNNIHQVRSQQQQVTQQKQTEATRQQQVETEIHKALANTELKWKSSDPDYEIKRTRVEDRIKLKLFEAGRAGKLPKSPEEAVRLAEEVKNEVDQEFRSFRPRKSAVTPVDGSTQAPTKPEAKNTEDVIRNALGA